MPEFTAEVLWLRDGHPFVDNRHHRDHLLRFDGGVEVYGSSSPQLVPAPMSDPNAVDPEEAFVASLASSHMLWFLSIAARRGFRVDRYADAAVGLMEENGAGKRTITVVTLRPEIRFSGEPRPTAEQIEDMHREAHAECFLANSVKTRVRWEAVPSI